MKRTHQVGSAHVVIIVVLVLALIAALGWIFYQNFIAKPQAEINNALADVDKQDKKTDRSTKETTSCMYYEKVCLTHPIDWEYRTSHERLDDRDGGTILKDYDELTSANMDVKITLSNGIGQIGGTCLPEENKAEGLVAEAKRTKLTVKTYEGDTKPVYALKMVVPGEGKFSPIVALSSSATLQKVGKHGACDFMYYGILEGRENKDGYGLMQISTEPFSSSNRPLMTYETAKRILDTSSYNEVFSVLSSVHTAR
ncbi:MAG TPA: hypothetical protein VGE13_01300 [Candidatus Saccharimonadales bacterium]